MKKLFPIAAIAMFAALSFSSCKKDHTCTCKIHVPASGDSTSGISNPAFDTTISYSEGKQKTSDAKSACDNFQKEAQQEYNLLSDSATVNCGI